MSSIKKKIESLNKIRQIEIMKILIQNNISISENNNGSFVNLSYVPQECIDEITEYLEYINDQEETLEEIETVKAEFIKEHFDVKNDTTIQTFDTVEETNDTTDTHLNI